MPHDTLDRGVDRPEAVVEPQPGGTQRRAAIIGQGTAHGEAIGARGLRGRIRARFQLPFERADFPHVLLELLLRMAIGFVDRLGGFPEIVKLAQLMGNARQSGPDGAANGVLPVREDAADGHGQPLLHLLQQGREILLGRTQEPPRQKDLPGETIPQDPDDLVAHVRLQAIEGQQHAPLLQQAVPQAVLLGQP